MKQDHSNSPMQHSGHFQVEGKSAQAPAFQLKASAAAPVQMQADETLEPGEAIADTCTYYVAEPKSTLRDDKDPKKATKTILKQGMKLKRLRVLGGISQYEVLDNAGSAQAIGSKIWTSTGNVGEETLIVDREMDYLVSAADTLSYAFSTADKCMKLAANTKVVAIRSVFHGKQGEMVQLMDETMKTNLGWVSAKNVKKMPRDLADDFAWMKDAGNWAGSKEKVEGDELKKIQTNRRGINDRTDDDTYTRTLYHPTKKDKKTKYEGYMYSDMAKDAKVEATGINAFEKQVNAALFEELSKEGSFGSINTWDGEIFTWGKGFSATGQLGLVLDELFKMDAKYRTLFHNVGLDLVGGMLCVIDDQGKRLQDVNKEKGMPASQFIKRSTAIQSFFIELAEKKSYREDIAKAQYKVLMNKAGNYPAYVMNATKTAYADAWNEGSVTMLAHLSHWLPSGSWNSVDYSDTKGKTVAVAERFIFKAVARSSAVGSKIADGVHVWFSTLPVYDKLAHFGIPKGSAQAAFDAVYPADSFIQDIQFKGEGSARKAYLKDTDTYLKDVCLLPANDSGTRFRVVTPGGKALSNYLIKDTEKK